MRVAAIGIGSSSVKMLTAQVEKGKILRLSHDRAETRLFEGLHENGQLDSRSMAETISAILQMRDKARLMDVERLYIFTTSVGRDARNGDEFRQIVLQKTGYPLDICSGEDEAILSYLGANDKGDCGVIDIGGGSTEYIIGSGSQAKASVSLQMGAVRLLQRFPVADERNIASIVAAAKEIFDKGASRIMGIPLPADWIGVGGAFTSLAAITRGAAWTDESRFDGVFLKHHDVVRLLDVLARMKPTERGGIRGLPPRSEDIIVHGVCILLASMDKLALSQIQVSIKGPLEGYIKQKYLLAT